MLLPRCKLPRITQRQIPQKILAPQLNSSEMNLLRVNRCKYLWNVCLMQNTPGGAPSLFPKWSYTDAQGLSDARSSLCGGTTCRARLPLECGGLTPLSHRAGDDGFRKGAGLKTGAYRSWMTP